MTSPWIDTAFVTVDTPFARPASFVALETVFITSAVLTFLHAWRAFRRGDRSAVFTWTTIVIYGLAMELVSYNWVGSFEHAQFTVMFYRRHLPLYIVGLYPVLLYTAIAMARRFRMRSAAEPFLVGLLIVCMDVPYDILGAHIGWWTWSDKDPNVSFRWQGVPVTCYYWYLTFGGILSALTRSVGAAVTRAWRPWKLALALPVAVLTILLGFVSFIPFHVLRARGIADGTIVFGLLATSVLVVGFSPKHRTRDRDGLLFAIPFVVYGFDLLMAVALLSKGELGLARKLGIVVLATLVGLAVNVIGHRSGIVQATRSWRARAT